MFNIYESLYLIISTIIVAVMLLVVLSIVYKSWRNGISPMPSSAHVRQVVANEVNQISKSGTLIDAGSGFGTLVMHIAQQCPEWKVIGIENSPVPLWISRIFVRFISTIKGIPLNSVSFTKGNLYSYNYTDIDVIVCYLYPGAMKQFERIANSQLISDTWVISICFAIPGWEPKQIITCKDLYRTKVYVYHSNILT